MEEQQYLYRVEKITHRPAAEDKITIIKEIRENDLELARILATKAYLEELAELQGKYSPESFKSYDTRKGIGYNYQLLLINNSDSEIYIVETTMEKITPAVIAQQEEEKEIFLTLSRKVCKF
ncbi:hypothetical protein JRG66_00850 [Salinimicrobium tongyeongense]|uniref:Uncharacterized protein n=1 Tax=Salinimicrobium tongyeongense TaxID=2809707 RepID=A0ABY6NRE5_9FLAO|nr:hypothetical protein [Salinimicrobium tongyeongense]UZH55480.1 hypothetical protein JRG66_00850 [Salinimicrobium tongyeongense]